jgi:hypothetical protein
VSAHCNEKSEDDGQQTTQMSCDGGEKKTKDERCKKSGEKKRFGLEHAVW